MAENSMSAGGEEKVARVSTPKPRTIRKTVPVSLIPRPQHTAPSPVRSPSPPSEPLVQSCMRRSVIRTPRQVHERGIQDTTRPTALEPSSAWPPTTGQVRVHGYVPLSMAVAVLHEVPHANPHGQTLHDYYFEFALNKAILTSEQTDSMSQSTKSRRAHIRTIYHNKVVEGGFITLVGLHHLMVRCQEELATHDPYEVHEWIRKERERRGRYDEDPTFAIVYWRPQSWKRNFTCDA
ncbi:hypothetical protein BDV97DRAFT_362509 [Delphinella strobiligena]|nr:hypothetical protein BDV97DRAFT_362509 [Delphinella strobiligena]